MWGNNNATSSIPIVQGVAVNSGHQSNTTTTNEVFDQDFGGSKGETQPKQFNDIFFALLFYAHLGVMGAFLVVSLGLAEQNGVGYSGIIYLCIVCGVFAIGLATVSLGFMMQFATGLVKVALFFSIGCSFAMGIIGLMSGQLIMGIMGLVSFAFGCCYAYMVWSRIPFAAANLTTALTAVRANLGTAIVAYIFLGLAMGWTMWWGVVTSGMMDAYGNGVLYLFLVSYYWTHQVLQNTVHVTVAGVIGTWWFSPDEASSFCSQAIFDSLTRASTFSFGSICFGSLIVALIQALRALNHHLRGNDEFQIVVCIIDCILGCIEAIVEYFNKWAYVYVGLYGYSYLDAGKNVIQLFQNKGWSVIVADNLVDNVLFMVSVGIGLITGLIGLVIAQADENIFANLNVQNPGGAGFIAGLLVGVVMSSILLNVVSSAVNTVIVCFAESPREFDAHHPQLSMEMRSAWRRAFPEECRQI
mmetsp:Transcript_33891/g.40611  ORF Transcript_33891/g.40611 Transcript_33891/m.40611 type:complete len:471 (-) Transcript_33891:283-1695(-)|eukprot:CAMPEP_0198254812 /NCGR_PEP_ID=MMETSP1447-20131203/5071_1 /TAXON_ID=420782 /ORGANISM="Chaetoceros dichaeta, Strain CCMP1751" /LENGTH=470 /DNA_ID=CAMNT_0043941019 /DNA_START=35 /DNA_END=1447 /DNA_ORIENTATION=-